MDERFKAVATDPRFRPIHQKQKKIEIDKRFKCMFTDDKFKTKYAVDKRGKPILESSSENLKKYYTLSKKERLREKRKNKKAELAKLLDIGKVEDEKDDDKEDEKGLIDEKGVEKKEENEEIVKQKLPSSKEDVESEEGSDSDNESSAADSDYESSDSEHDSGPDLARGEGNVESSSESEDEFYQDVREGPKFDHDWNELDKDAERSDEISRRLAVCNMDWDRIKAQDLYILFHSFKPQMGRVVGVTIYPSEFGRERMKEEEMKGPTEFINKEVEPTEDEVGGSNNSEDLENGGRYNAEKLRQYQIKRLKYYYAVVECDSPDTANAIYEECDGMEFETSSARFDIRFIPDDVTFDDDVIKEKCCELPEKDTYEPCAFVTTALNQAKVDLTWDETDRSRVNLTTKKFTDEELQDMDMKDFLASSSSEEEEEEETNNEGYNGELGLASKMSKADQIDMYRSLLLGDVDEKSKKDEKDVHMEVSWNPDDIKNDDDDEKSDDDEEEDEETKKLMAEMEEQPDNENNEGEESDDDDGSEADDESEEEGGDEKQQQKELELLMMEEKEEQKHHFDMKEILKTQENREKGNKRKGRKFKKKNEDEEGEKDDFEMNLDDSRFKAVYSSSEFALDPNNPAFKKSRGMQELLKEGQKRRTTNDYDVTTKKKVRVEETLNNNNDISKLIKSVKAKTKQRFNGSSKKK